MGLMRLFLALVVAADHWRLLKLSNVSASFEDSYKLGFNAGYAVMFFYAISGFLITYTLSRNYSQDIRGSLKFYKNRFIRIFSLYWPLVLAAFLLVDNSWSAFLSRNLADQLTGIFLIGMDWQLSFGSYPTPHFEAAIPGLEQAWTLGAELLFYLAAPLLMRSWKTAVTLLAVSFGLRAAFVVALGVDLHQVWTYHFAVTSFGFFMLGHLICRAARRWNALAQPGIGYAMLLCSLASMMFGGSYAGYDTARFWLSVLFFTLALPGLFEGTKDIGWMNVAGDLSYPIYLVHTLVLYVFGGWLLAIGMPTWLLPPLGAAYVSIVVYLVAVIGAAFAVHKLVEVPVSKAMHKWLSWRRSALAASSAQS